MKKQEDLTKQEKEKELLAIVIIGLIAGMLIYLVIEANKNAKKQDQLSTAETSKLQHELNLLLESNDEENSEMIIANFIKDNSTIFHNQIVTIVKQEVNKEVGIAVQSLINSGTFVTPQTFNNIAGKNLSQNNTHAKIDSESITLATDEEMKAKIGSIFGKESLHADLRKLNSKNKEGIPVLENEEIDELITYLSCYCPHKPISKVFHPRVSKEYVITFLFYQIYKKHKLGHDTAEKYAKFIIKHIAQFRDKTVKSITSNWAKPGRNKSRIELETNSDLILL